MTLIHAEAAPFNLPKPTPYFKAVSPIFGYDPAYGTLLGLAWFSYPTGEVEQAKTRKSLNLVLRFGPHGAVSYQQQMPELFGPVGLDFRLSANNFYDYDVQESDSTISNTYDQISVMGEIKLRYQINPKWQGYAGPHFDWQTHEQHNDDVSSGYGFIGIQRDSRDDKSNGHKGSLTTAEIKFQSGLMNSDSEQSSVQIRADGRWFIPLTERQTLAVHALAESSTGPGFVSEAGGSELLRGYFGQQFSSEHMLAGQLEYRFPVWRFIKGVTFIDTVNLFENDEADYHASAGLGFRFGLPPDQSMSVRWDIGFNEQGHVQTYVNFNQVF